MDDNVITFTPKKSDTRSTEERIYECFHATIMFDAEHQKKCIYCIHNAATGKMLFDILVKDMSDSAKNKHLTLTVYDLRNTLSNVLKLINDTETAVLKEQYELAEAEEARKKREGSLRLAPGREPEAEKGNSEFTQGISEITPPDFEE